MADCFLLKRWACLLDDLKDKTNQTKTAPQQKENPYVLASGCHQIAVVLQASLLC